MKITSKGDKLVEIELELGEQQQDVVDLFSTLLPLAQNYAHAKNLLRDQDVRPADKRGKAVRAVEMLMEISINDATRLSRGMRDVASGRAGASDFGFPEFDDDAVEGTYD